MPTINKKGIQLYYKPKYKSEARQRAEQFYKSGSWYFLRNQHITDYPICEDCAKRGITKPAVDVHHVIPYMWFADEDMKWTAFLDEDNLVSLCRRCHLDRHEYLNSLGGDIQQKMIDKYVEKHKKPK